jgi:hypothetical protein
MGCKDIHNQRQRNKVGSKREEEGDCEVQTASNAATLFSHCAPHIYLYVIINHLPLKPFPMFIALRPFLIIYSLIPLLSLSKCH